MDNQSAATLQSRSTYSDSSKTGSTKSGISIDKEKDRDLTKDNALSPIDLECLIQKERITKILKEAIYKTKLTVALPHLVKEFTTLNSILSRQNMDDLLFIFEQYENPLFSASMLNMDVMEEIKAGEVTLRNRLNPELAHLVYIMHSYPALKAPVEEMIDEMRLEYKSGKKMSPAFEFLLVLEHFLELMVNQLSLTAAEELVAKINTRKLEASNDKLVADITETSETLKLENTQFEEDMARRKLIIEELEAELDDVLKCAATKVKKMILDSDRQMVLATRAHTVKNDMLQEEQEEATTGYTNALRSNLKDEKNLRARRFKVETQLMSWLQKYDVEMGDKQLELDEFEQKYLEEVEKCKVLEEKIAIQDIEYLPLMAEREEEYHNEMAEKMQKFLVEHAARVIQKAWRDTLANRAEKKKLKKILKRMKDEAEGLLKKKGGKKK